jgi:hypothetical protein
MSDAIRVVYVVGSSHSGSTLLALLADEHPEIASVGETAVKPRIRREGRSATQPCSCGAALQDCAFWQRIFTTVSGQGLRFDATCWSNDYRFDNPWLDLAMTRETSAGLLLAFRRWVQRHVPAYRARVSRINRVNVALMRAVLAQTGAVVFFDATKLLTRLTYLLSIPELDVRVVRLVRDVRGVAASAKRRGASPLTAAQVWHNDQVAIDRALSKLSPDRHLLVRYEQLCADPQDTLVRLWAFCGVQPLAPPTTLRSREHHVIGNSMRIAETITIRVDDSWRTRLSEEEQRRILGFAGGMNRAVGYA